MELKEIKWLIFGSATIAGVSSLPFATGIMNAFVPMPFYMIFMFWFIFYGILVVLPLLYLIEFIWLSGKRSFGKIILIMSLILSALNLIYLINSWEYGVKYQGEQYMKIVAFENIFGFGSLIALVYIGMKAKSKDVLYSANLYMFCLLAWCAFPYLR